MIATEAAVLAQDGEFVTLADGLQYEVKFNMRSLRDLERKYGSLTLFSMAIAGASETHGMIDAFIDGLAYGLRHLGPNRFGSPEAMLDLVALGQGKEYIRAVTRALNTALTGTPDSDDEQPDEGWTDLPQDVRAALVDWAETAIDSNGTGALVRYVKRHQPAEQSTEDGEVSGNFLGAPGTGS